jgi:KEOPS complex subunit Cgi121
MELVEGTETIEDVASFVAEIDEISTRYDATIQVFDARYVVDKAHIERAVELAQRARERDDCIADDFGVEILLYAAGRRQIQNALTMGVSEGDCPVVAVVVGGDERGAVAELQDRLKRAELLGNYDEDRVREFFNITDTELSATDGTLADIVRERVALLPIEK